MANVITIPTALKDKALSEISECTNRALPNLGEKERATHVERMFDQQWQLAQDSYERTIAPFVAESEQRMLDLLNASGLQGAAREEVERSTRRRLAEDIGRMKPFHSQTIFIMLTLSGMEDETAHAIVDQCFFPEKKE